VSITVILISLIWGLCCGYGLTKLAEAFINTIISLHGLFLRRWKWLANKSAPGMISYSIILDLLIRTLLMGTFFGVILRWGDDWVRHKTAFNYSETVLIIWGVAATLTALISLKPSWQKVRIAWKISHEYDYAQKRKRTFLLRH